MIHASRFAPAKKNKKRVEHYSNVFFFLKSQHSSESCDGIVFIFNKQLINLQQNSWKHLRFIWKQFNISNCNRRRLLTLNRINLDSSELSAKKNQNKKKEFSAVRLFTVVDLQSDAMQN